MAAIHNVNGAPVRAIEQNNNNDSWMRLIKVSMIAGLVIGVVSAIFVALGMPVWLVSGLAAGAFVILNNEALFGDLGYFSRWI